MSRDLSSLPISLDMYTSVIHGEGPLYGMSALLLPTWRRSIRRIGGFWLGTAVLKGDQFSLTDFFLVGLGRVIRETVGGITTWSGFLGRMELTQNGITYVRDWLDIANKVKCLYTRIGDNLLTNGSAETGAWTPIGSGTTSVQSTTWRTDGNYSDHITTNAAAKGATVQTGITIVEGKAYDLTCDVNIISGTWAVDIYVISTGSVLASAVENTAGLKQMRCSIPETNLFAGEVGVEFKCRVGAAEIYADNAVFQEAPLKADTGWHQDLKSKAVYGDLWEVLLESSLTDQAATSKVLTHLAKHAWARSSMPDQFSGPAGSEESLAMTFYGDAYTLRQKHISFTGSNAASTILEQIFLETEIVTAGKIEANTMSYQIDTRAPLTHWDVIQGILKAGDTNGNIWSGGCYGGHKFNYFPVSTTPVYHYRGGDLLTAAGGVTIPWEARPEVVYADDIPVGPGQVSGSILDDPRCFVLDEVDFDAAEWLAGGSGLKFNKMAEQA